MFSKDDLHRMLTANPFVDGTFLVGGHIEPDTYRAQMDAQMIYGTGRALDQKM